MPAFKDAGVTAPKTWAQLIKDANTLKASGTPAFSIGGADGWTLTDLFENIYLRTYGVAKYDALATHKIKWTDASVKKALTYMGQILGNSANLAGGSSGALQYNFNDSVTNASRARRRRRWFSKATSSPGVILSSTKAKANSGFNVAPFPLDHARQPTPARSRSRATCSSRSATTPRSRRS